mmetsp:Transcript_1423/g.2221  ORF Transcript_1423/g.2221 Transcript_1423/m.2221 type:complete len:104 (-) Transcript_1423:75-386(-)
MQGHSASNVVPVVASNRIGFEKVNEEVTVASPSPGMTFYGSSFITDSTGEKVKEMDTETDGFISFTFDVDDINMQRTSWGVFRDRRPALYTPITTKDGHNSSF